MLRAGNSFIKSLLEWVLVLVIAFGASMLIRTFVVSPYVVPTGSMESTILVGDNVLAQKVTLELGRGVSTGDIVVFNNPDASSGHDVLVKRVIAQAGQVVDLRGGVVYVDGKPLDEPYTQGKSYPLDTQAPGVSVSFPYTVPEGSVWVMGDNRENSADSRYFGAVPQHDLIGVVFFRYWPFDRIGAM